MIRILLLAALVGGLFLVGHPVLGGAAALLGIYLLLRRH